MKKLDKEVRNIILKMVAAIIFAALFFVDYMLILDFYLM